MRRRLDVLVTIVVACVLMRDAAVRADELESVDAYYRSVISHMSHLPQPPLVSYDAVVRASGATFYVSRDPQSGEAEFGFSVGPALGDTSRWWPVLVRTKDNMTSVQLDTARAVTRFPALNATWGGIDSWMRFGMQEATARPEPAPLATAAATSREMPVIAIVHSFDPGIYRARDGGWTTCADNSTARLIRLTARDDAARHPATDIGVQASTQTICTIRFALEHSDLIDRNGYVELHIARVGSYYVVERGEISFDAGAKLGRQHVRLFIDYVRIAFPTVSPPGTFPAPAAATRPS